MGQGLLGVQAWPLLLCLRSLGLGFGLGGAGHGHTDGAQVLGIVLHLSQGALLHHTHPNPQTSSSFQGIPHGLLGIWLAQVSSWKLTPRPLQLRVQGPQGHSAHSLHGQTSFTLSFCPPRR